MYICGETSYFIKIPFRVAGVSLWGAVVVVVVVVVASVEVVVVLAAAVVAVLAALVVVADTGWNQLLDVAVSSPVLWRLRQGHR